MKDQLFFLITAFVFSGATLASETSQEEKHALSLGGYLETYYIHDFDHGSSNTRPSFAYSHNRLGAPSINLAIIKVKLESENIRANLALGSGSYMRANYALEPDDLQKVFEANVGLKLSDQYNLWLDAGVLPSHIGFESAIGAENWTLTRSILADNSPYFETGLRVSYTSEDGKWYASGLLLNGWQRIQRSDGSTMPSIGHQLTYKPNSKITLNSSSFIGNDKSDQNRKMRYFHNFYGQYQLNEDWSLIAGFDIGAEQKARGSSHYNLWFTPIAIARYRYSDKLGFSLRAEYYQDKNGVIVDTGTPSGFRTMSYSANADFKVLSNVTLRAELRKFHSKDKVYLNNDQPSQNNLIATTAIIFAF
ncbi:MAG: porin [Methylotenera sp.]|nr:porin [Methylotenera sp.]MDP1755000.1 porin [Methylotenera sp.]MDP1958393.1 porin [Methylotenera sp.]MDP3302546.1 porin [Methylotenera sp.]MDP3943622.1 porin [Methylotenera sp.]